MISGAEEVMDVRLAEIIPADDRGEGEEQEADGDEDVAVLAHKTDLEGLLDEDDALLDGLAVRVEVRVEDSGGHDGEDRDVQDDEGIDEDGDDAQDALLHGVIDLRDHVGSACT